MEAIWLTSLRKFLNNADGAIKIDKHTAAPLHRQGDAFLMDMAVQPGKYKLA
jgi:hypothetical protein